MLFAGSLAKKRAALLYFFLCSIFIFALRVFSFRFASFFLLYSQLFRVRRYSAKKRSSESNVARKWKKKTCTEYYKESHSHFCTHDINIKQFTQQNARSRSTDSHIQLLQPYAIAVCMMMSSIYAAINSLAFVEVLLFLSFFPFLAAAALFLHHELNYVWLCVFFLVVFDFYFYFFQFK